MKNFKWATALLALTAAPAAFAVCKINDEVVPCDAFWAKFGWMFGVFWVFGLATFAFLIWMIVDCIKRKPNNQALWLVVIFTGNILGARMSSVGSG